MIKSFKAVNGIIIADAVSFIEMRLAARRVNHAYTKAYTALYKFKCAANANFKIIILPG